MDESDTGGVKTPIMSDEIMVFFVSYIYVL